jgi:splicing factor 1
MSWRNQGITGSNNIPLGKRRFGGESNGDSRRDDSPYGDSGKRGRSPTRGPSPNHRLRMPTNSLSAEASVDGVKRRKKRNRWGDANDNKAAGLMGLPTKIEANMTSEQLEAYTLHLRIEEISQKLRINDVVPGEGDRYAPYLFFCAITNILQIPFATSPVRQSRSTCQHSRVPLPQEA